jgi:hypothetical protein
MSESYFYHHTGNAIDFTANGVDYGSFNYIAVFTTNNSGTVYGISGTGANGWNDVSAADAGPSPGSYTLTSDYPFGSAILYGGGTSPNGIGGGVLEIDSGAFSGDQTVVGGSLILDTNVQVSSAFSLTDAYVDFEGGTGGASVTFSQDSTVKLTATPITGNNTNFNGLTFLNFANGDGIAAPTGYHYNTAIAPVYTAGSPGTLTFTLVNNSTGAEVAVTLSTTLASGTTPDFTFTTDAQGDPVLAQGPFVVCYVASTRILTADGERPVETLLPGDIVLTVADEDRIPAPVKWIGRRRIDLAAHSRPETVAPIRICRDAFAPGMPHSDLLVSPDHGIFADGMLICARQLINGTTIRQEIGWTSVDYFHVELDGHAVLLAEGLPAESYLDTGNRGFFANSDAPLVLHPDLTSEADYPDREAASCVPFVWDEANVFPVWQRLANRAVDLGPPAVLPETATDPHLCVVAKGRTVRPLCSENGLFIFALPKETTQVRLVSRAAAPTDAKPWMEDRRRLGVYVERIQVRAGNEVWDVPLDHPELSQGWWAVERSGIAMRRWTDGNAFLSLPMSNKAVVLEIRAGTAGISYVKDADSPRLVA